MQIKKTWALLFACFFLTACIPEHIVPPPEIYTLSPDWDNLQQTINKHQKHSAIIKLATVYASQDLTSNGILYANSQYSRNRYAYSRWNEAPTKLMQTLIQASIEKSGLFEAVLPATSTSKADLILESTLQDLSHHIKNKSSSEGIVRIGAYLIDNSTRTVLASEEFVSKVPASEQNAQAAVVALNKAAQNVAEELVTWLANNINHPKKTTSCSTKERSRNKFNN